MSDLRPWARTDSAPFRFGATAQELLVVSVRHEIFEPGPDGPRKIGTIHRRFVDGELVEEHETTERAP